MDYDRRTRRSALQAIATLCAGAGLSGCVGSGSSADTASSNEPPSPTSTSINTTSTATTSHTPSQTAPPTETTAVSTESTTTGSTRTTGTASPTTERGAYTVGMYTDLYFDPIGLFVEPGQTVSFELVSGVHSATAYHPDNEAAFERRVPKAVPSWNTGVFDETGTSRNMTFEVEGTHDYFCIPHKQLGMIGRIVVGDSGGPATRSSNLDSDLPDSERIVEQGSIPYEAFAEDR